jgi:hypothetical protein
MEKVKELEDTKKQLDSREKQLVKYTGDLSSFPHFPDNMRFVGTWDCGYTYMYPNGG